MVRRLPVHETRDGGSMAATPTRTSQLGVPSRQRTRLAWPWSGSGIAHALIIAALLFLTVPRPKPGSPEPPTVEMVFGHNGSSGSSGASVPLADRGSNDNPQTKPTPVPAPEPLETPTQLDETPPTPPAPTPPQPSVTHPPVTISKLAPPAPAPSRARPVDRARKRPRHRPAQSSNPFQNLTDLSLDPSGEQTPRSTRRGHGSSGGASINLSLGPFVKGGRLSMPFSVHGAQGISGDYMSMLDDWVEAHKYYPQSAAQRGDDGEVTLHVVWDRNGRVLHVTLLSGSGDTDLDDAWQGLFRGAHLPAPPPDVTGDPIQMDMTMHYILLH